MEKKLNIYFTTENKKTYHIAISHPKDDLSKATVEAVAQNVNVNIKMYKSDKIKMYNYSKLI